MPTHIKQVRTSAPKDVKAAKEQRVKGRIAAKEKSKEKSKPKSGKVRAEDRVAATATGSTSRRTS